MMAEEAHGLIDLICGVAGKVVGDSSHSGGNFAPLAGSINGILEILWPKIDTYVRTLLTTDVQKTMEESLPAALSGLKFDKTRCSLGPKPLKFKDITVEKVVAQTHTGPCEIASIKCIIDWNADTEIYLNFGPVSIGIESLIFSGCLLIEMVNLIPQPPFMKGVRIFFNDTPKIDFKFGGLSSSVLNLGMARDQIKKAVCTSLDAAMVVPNRMGFIMTPCADIFNIKCPPSQGFLKVKLLGAVGLRGADFSFSGSKSDPYAIAHFGGQAFKTPTIKGTVNPMWNHEMIILVADYEHQKLSIEVLDYDVVGSADHLGSVVVPAKTLLQWAGHGNKEVQLQNEKGEEGKFGFVRINVIWSPLMVKDVPKSVGVNGLVIFGIHSATGLPKGPPGTLYWASVSCTGVMLGFPAEPKETPKVAEPIEDDDDEDMESQRSVGNLGPRVKILQRYGLTMADMASVLQVDTESFKAAIDSSVKNAAALDEKIEQRIATLSWEHGFEFPVNDALSSSVTCAIWRAEADKTDKPDQIGTIKFDVFDLKYAKNSTKWKTADIPGTKISIKVKFALRHFASATQ